MDEYSFLADCLSTFRSVNDWVKALIVITPFVFGLAALRLVLRKSDNRTTQISREARRNDSEIAGYLEHTPIPMQKMEPEPRKAVGQTAWL